jgi:hypothetical protein
MLAVRTESLELAAQHRTRQNLYLEEVMKAALPTQMWEGARWTFYVQAFFLLVWRCPKVEGSGKERIFGRALRTWRDLTFRSTT